MLTDSWGSLGVQCREQCSLLTFWNLHSMGGKALFAPQMKGHRGRACVLRSVQERHHSSYLLGDLYIF